MRPKESRKEMDLNKVNELKQYLKSSREKDPCKVLQLTRESLGLSQNLLAEIIGITPTTVCRWERKAQTQRILTWEQCLALNEELNKIGLSIFDFSFFTVLMEVPELDNINSIQQLLKKG